MRLTRENKWWAFGALAVVVWFLWPKKAEAKEKSKVELEIGAPTITSRT